MKLTCLSKGRGFHSPPCHILELSGFRILLECPMDLSALTVFDPLLTADFVAGDIGDVGKAIHTGSHQNNEMWAEREQNGDGGAALSKNDLINALPWYKIAGSLNLWSISLIDVVVISSPMGMLGLPFLTRHSGFSAKIYATEVTAKIGRLMMEDLVSMHSEYFRFYGPEEDVGGPEWMKWNELQKLPKVLREIIMGKTGENLGSWLPLYGLEDIDECMSKVQGVKYAEESCYNGILILKAFSSGMEIGAANWMLTCPQRSITYLSSSILQSGTSMGFNYHSLKGNDVLLFSDFYSLPEALDFSNATSLFNSQEQLFDEDSSVSSAPKSREKYDDDMGAINHLDDNTEKSEESEKLDFICSCAIETIRGGGSVLVPIGRLSILLQLLEKISELLDSLNLKVPMYMISSSAEETLVLANVLPEWLCLERQEKLYSGLPLFGHAELIKGKKLQLFPAIYSSKLIRTWQEPCIVFSPHWTLRLGPAIHLLRQWSTHENCLLIMEQGTNVDVALLPFMPIAIKVLQCSFLSGIVSHKVQPLLQILKPKIVLFPEVLKAYVPHKKDASVSFLYYTENRLLSVPSLRDGLEACLPVELLQSPVIMDVSRFKGKLQVCNGKFTLVPKKVSSDLPYKQLHWGTVDPRQLLISLEEKGIKGSLNEGDTPADGDGIHHIVVCDHGIAVIEMSPNKTVITASEKSLATLVYEVVNSVSDGA